MDPLDISDKILLILILLREKYGRLSTQMSFQNIKTIFKIISTYCPFKKLISFIKMCCPLLLTC